MSDIGFDVDTGEATPLYQYLTFLVDLPGTAPGRWKLFGLWGKSNIELGTAKEDTLGNSYNTRGTATDFGSGLSVVGVSNSYYFNPKVRLKSTASVQRVSAGTVLDSIRNNGEDLKTFVRQHHEEDKVSFSTQLKYKISSRDNYTNLALNGSRVYHENPEKYKEGVRTGVQKAAV